MPELPEVELHRRHLESWLAGHVVENAEAHARLQLQQGTTWDHVRTAVTGARVTGVQRRGKHLFISLHARGALYVHLGMTGHFSRRAPGEPAPRFLAWSLVTGRGSRVDFTDARRFGRVGHVPGGMEADATVKALGPDLLEDPPTARGLVERLHGRRGPIKVVLMDQQVLAGLGNIHAAEALWEARIPPTLRAADLDVRGATALLKGIRRTFHRVLDDDDGEGVAYVEVAGNPNPFRIYARQGEPCPRCGAPIQRFTQAGRSTYHCAECQRA